MADRLSYEVEIKELIYEAFEDFSSQNITRLLSEMCLVEAESKGTIKDFERYVLLESFNDEVYSKEERTLISSISNFVIYPSFSLQLKREEIICNIFAADLIDCWDPISAGILFLKIINKSTEGFNIAIIRLSDGIHIGCRTFSNEKWRDCILSTSNDMEEIIANISDMTEQDSFLGFYSEFVEIITPTDKKDNFEERVIKKRGAKEQYLETLSGVEKDLQIDCQFEKDSYLETFEEDLHKENFCTEFIWTLEDLKSIQPTHINSMELLFEAEEIEEYGDENRIERSIEYNELDQGLETYDETADLIGKCEDDPEQLIKLLKRKQGIL